MVGQQVSHYEIVEKLGEGGMGVVYKARDLRLERFAAIKVLSAERALDPISRRRFLREAQAASVLNHPHIITIYDILSESDTDLIVMEYVSGHSLRQMIPSTGMPVWRATEYAAQIANALAAAHKAGLIHRDLKPANVMVNPDGRVKVLDFGLAKLSSASQSDSGTVVTQTGTVVGTVTYMAPEQAMGLPMDHRADVFSFGVTLYEMLSGAVPFRGANSLAVLHAIRYDEPRPLTDLRPDVPPALDALVRRALAKTPEERFGSMQEIEVALRRVLAASAAADRASDSTPTESIVLPQPRTPGPITAAMAKHSSSDDRHSIAVLPFRCLSADKDDMYTAEGITTEMITALSGVPGVRVAPQLASTHFQESSPNLRAVAENLKVRYILTGSLRRSGKRMRLIAELSDVALDEVIWSRTYDRAVEDVFALQEEIARAVVGAASGQILRARSEEASRISNELLDAHGLVRKAYHFWNYAFRIEGVQESLDLLRRALELEPDYAAAHGFLAFYLNQRVMNFISPDTHADRAEAIAEADRAFELAPGDPEVLEIIGVVCFCTAQPDKAVMALRRAVKLAPFNLVAWGYLAMTLGWGGDDREVAEAQEILDRLMAEAPDHPSLPYWHYFKAGACFRQQNYEAAAENARKCFELQPRYLAAKMGVANALGALGRIHEARAAWSEVLSANPYITQSAYMENISAIARTPERTEPHVRGFFAAGIFQRAATNG